MAYLTSRQTRSQSRQRTPSADTDTVVKPRGTKESSDAATAALGRESSQPRVKSLAPRLTTSNTGLAPCDLKLLFAKREKLQAPDAQLRSFIDGNKQSFKRHQHLERLTSSIRAAFVFAQEEAGTAVCISPHGHLLTCAHCVAEDVNEAIGKMMWLISAEGQVVRAQCSTWDERRDLALLRITDAEAPSHGPAVTWPHAQLAPSMPQVGGKLVCVGHPGSEDLEATTPGQATGYDVLHVSEGRYRGVASGQDVHDNSEIGALMHDCWTYWGHSGAPLIETSNGNLIGLHSSWDDQTGMRRGVALQAIRAFLLDSGGFETAEGGTKQEDGAVGSRDMPILLE